MVWAILLRISSKEVFDILSQERPIRLHLAAKNSEKFIRQYNQAEQGECFIVFNSLGLLEIGIYKGNASNCWADMMGMEYF